MQNAKMIEIHSNQTCQLQPAAAVLPPPVLIAAIKFRSLVLSGIDGGVGDGACGGESGAGEGGGSERGSIGMDGGMDGGTRGVFTASAAVATIIV